MNTHRGRRRLLALAITLTGFVLPPEAHAANKTVSETGSQFVDQKVTITVGTTVVWQFADSQSVRHSVTFDDNSFDQPSGCSKLVTLPCQGPGDTVERTFAGVGTFYYHCKIHGAPRQGMFGIVEVQPTSGTPGSSGATTSSTAKASSSTTTTVKASTSSSTTTTTRPLATSSTLISSSTTTTTSEATSVLLPGDPPSFSDDTSSAGNRSGGSKGGSDSGTVALIVGLLLAVSAGGGLLLWRLRPGRP